MGYDIDKTFREICPKVGDAKRQISEIKEYARSRDESYVWAHDFRFLAAPLRFCYLT